MESVLRLEIARAVLDAIGAHAAAAVPEECCGALIGSDDEGGRRVAYAVPLDNAAEERREARYLVLPAAVVALEQEAEDAGFELLGFYHSHPSSAPEPSGIDLRHAWPWYTYLIVSPAAGSGWDVRAWRLAESGTRFDEERLTVLEGEPA